MSTIHSLPPVMQRYELKYLIPLEYIDLISDYVSLYCCLDHYSELAAADQYFYPVTSLYLDSPGHQLLKQRMEGKEERFNMRVRCYTRGGDTQYFLEVKNRIGIRGVVIKYRAILQQSEWPGILTDPLYRPLDSDSVKEKMNKELFLRLALSYAIEPKILTKYHRKAYFSEVDDYARVTFDTNLQYRLEPEYTLDSNHGMTNYDNETIYANNTRSEACVVLELKCNAGSVPSWMLDLIRIYELKQVSFSKYMNSVLVAHRDNGEHFMSFDRQTLFSDRFSGK